MAAATRGHLERLPSGSYRVHAYGGTDPVTGKPRRIRVTCSDDATAAATLGRLLGEVDEERFPNRDATLGHALDKYLEVADLEVSTREAHEGYIRRTIKPVLGQVKIRKLGADSLDSLYAALKRCCGPNCRIVCLLAFDVPSLTNSPVRSRSLDLIRRDSAAPELEVRRPPSVLCPRVPVRLPGARTASPAFLPFARGTSLGARLGLYA